MDIKRDRFLRLVDKRVNGALKKIRLVGNLADTRHYAYTEEEKKRILSSLQSELNDVKSSFNKRNNTNFSIKDE